MIVVSQNLLKYGVEIPPDSILRLNLAWHEKLRTASELLVKHRFSKIFLDIPRGRKKPPNYNHETSDIMALVSKFPNIEYIAISNIENSGQVIYYQGLFSNVKIVPKIESYIGIKNAADIIATLNYWDKVVMLDHQDLYSDLDWMGREKEYLELVAGLEETCKRLGCYLLRTVGVVFSGWEDDK